MLRSGEIESFIGVNPQAVVSYVSRDHQGYKNEDPNCVGIIFEGDLYLIENGNDQTAPPYYVVESETRAHQHPGDESRFRGISEIGLVNKFDTAELRMAQRLLKAVAENQSLRDYRVFLMKSVNGFGIRKQLPAEW
ncbi:MAG: hypothetical protein ABIH82_05685 [Candidatus Woesearchaeota archaeon]